ncbi:MAG: hypothetical protein KME49_04370 [Brasilonema octagenarum HA4186-MV1]|jgi:hypothetical protein|uniref:Uncharacterized protein n=2 Tax=Brasilonema TaxID=383614 RepID=A0A856MPY0_9CYAN|nr:MULTISPECIES: hypothetical protein [Brasilonema]MBW4624750.1 hypothetical protein [Brasilonema octagenarum HA4186-MV1]NMF65138.1 hypothetical protein [Brasilonema octagenarum UFV-OR1]QDL11066.1 hypothetical protein DP114_27035 [Brasilonema sennae CENA114]QDL17410.1 hypothetical protein DP113_26960 [Brasilonema octagenarum UFV-E1]
MNLPVIVDIAVGLIFIYLILSLLTSEVQELISTFLQWRGKHLKKSIQLLVAGGSETQQQDIDDATVLVHKLYQDPLINTLNQQAQKLVEKEVQEINQFRYNSKALKEKQSSPSYIPSETFAITLLEALRIPELVNFVQTPSERKTNLYMVLSSYKQLKTAITDKNSDSYQQIHNIYGDITENNEFKKLVQDLPEYVPNNLITSLSVLAQRSKLKIDNIKDETSQFQKEVETWFDRSMDRASGVYKRNAKGVAILIGISVAILTNTDTFFLLKRLSQDSAVRSAITESAIQQKDFLNDQNARSQFQELLGNASVPIGWQNISQQFEPLKTSRGNSAQMFILRIWLAFKILFGWIVSGLAIAMGAPFWFDVLNKVINVRNSGPKPVAYTKDQPPEK